MTGFACYAGSRGTKLNNAGKAKRAIQIEGSAEAHHHPGPIRTSRGLLAAPSGAHRAITTKLSQPAEVGTSPFVVHVSWAS